MCFLLLNINSLKWNKNKIKKYLPILLLILCINGMTDYIEIRWKNCRNTKNNFTQKKVKHNVLKQGRS